MPLSGHSEDRLQIGKLQLEYSVCADQSSAWSAQQRLDRLLEETVRQKLNGLFDPLRAAGDGLWFIRRLELAADIDLDLSDREIMLNWSRQFARALQQRMLDDTTRDLIYFPDYQSYLAQFVVAVAQGVAWQVWYFRSFAGLRSLPSSMAIVTALLQQPDIGLSALLGMPRADLARVLNTLTAQGAQQLLTGMAEDQQTSSLAVSVQLLVLIEQLDQQHSIPLLVTDHPWLETLELYLRVIGQRPDCTGVQFAELVLAAVTLRELTQTLPDRGLIELESAILTGCKAELFQTLPITQAQRLQPLTKLQRTDKQQLINAVRPEAVAHRAHGQFSDPRYTPYGGVFLLLPLLQQLPLEQLLESWPDPPAGDKQAAIRLLLLAQCLGTANAVRVFNDPVIRDLTGVPPGLTVIQLLNWLDSIKPRQVSAAQQQYAGWRLGEPDNSLLSITDCPFANRRLAIVAERNRGCWLLLRGYQPLRMSRLRQALIELLPQAAVADLNLRLHAGTVEQATKPALIRADLEYLQVPAKLRPGNCIRWLLTVMAQGVLRDFTWRLPGFAGSSLSHVHNNFLGLSARLEFAPDRWLVRLDRPALNVILSMTGMARNHYRLDWLDNQLVELYQGD